MSADTMPHRVNLESCLAVSMTRSNVNKGLPSGALSDNNSKKQLTKA